MTRPRKSATPVQSSPVENPTITEIQIIDRDLKIITAITNEKFTRDNFAKLSGIEKRLLAEEKLILAKKDNLERELIEANKAFQKSAQDYRIITKGGSSVDESTQQKREEKLSSETEAEIKKDALQGKLDQVSTIIKEINDLKSKINNKRKEVESYQRENQVKNWRKNISGKNVGQQQGIKEENLEIKREKEKIKIDPDKLKEYCDGLKKYIASHRGLNLQVELNQKKVHFAELALEALNDISSNSKRSHEELIKKAIKSIELVRESHKDYVQKYQKENRFGKASVGDLDKKFVEILFNLKSVNAKFAHIEAQYSKSSMESKASPEDPVELIRRPPQP